MQLAHNSFTSHQPFKLIITVTVHTMEFSCPVCYDTFSSQDVLRRHRSNKHAQNFAVTVNDVEYPVSVVEGSHRFRCPIEGCGKTYEGRDGLRKHVKDRHNSHHGGSTAAPPAKNLAGLQQQSSTQVPAPQGLIWFL